MPGITRSGVWTVPGPAGPVLERAGIHPSHGLAIQSFADDLERIVVSRCATPAGIQLLDEGYPCKGFGIKAKSCDWGPFTGFAMAHTTYAKFAGGNTTAAYKNQAKFFDKARSDTGFLATDVGGLKANIAAVGRHSSMAGETPILLSAARLQYLKNQNEIRLNQIADGEMIFCNSPFGLMGFILVDLRTNSTATWGIMHRDNFAVGPTHVVLQNGGAWSLVRGMRNTSPGGSSTDPSRQCCTGDYDLWGVFPKRDSRVASTRSLAEHGMDRQMRSFSAATPQASPAVLQIIKNLQANVRDSAWKRRHHVYGDYQEDREKGNISALTLHSAREMNRRIRIAGYQGGDMFHHNDDLGNPYRSDVEEELIAFVPGDPCPHFIESTTTGDAANGHMGWNAWVRQYERSYKVYDNVAIHRTRS